MVSPRHTEGGNFSNHPTIKHTVTAHGLEVSSIARPINEDWDAVFEVKHSSSGTPVIAGLQIKPRGPRYRARRPQGCGREADQDRRRAGFLPVNEEEQELKLMRKLARPRWPSTNLHAVLL